MSSEVSTRRLVAAVVLLALAFTSLTQTGCTRPIRRLGILDELAIAYRDRVWAQRAYNLRFANCNRQYEDHFKNGFCAGYSDVCNGGDGYLPALPPEHYRGYEYQCAEGSKCVDSWFEGYPAGVAAAREEKAGSYHEMHVSRMIDKAITQNKAPNILPSDVPVNKPSATLLPPTDSVVTKKFAQSDVSSAPRVASKTRLAVKRPEVKKLSPSKPAIVPASAGSVSVAKTTKVPSVVKSPAGMKTPGSKSKASTAALPPIVQGKTSRKTSGKSSVPPIVQGKSSKSTVASLPPVVRGRKIDPSTSVSAGEIPLPMAVRSSFEPRTAAWPVNRK